MSAAQIKNSFYIKFYKFLSAYVSDYKSSINS